MEQQSQNIPTPATYEQLRLLAQRLLSPRFGPVGVNADVTFLPGELPSELVNALPLPLVTRIIGTMRASMNTSGTIICIIDIPGERADILVHFATTLPVFGWQFEDMPHTRPRQGGFNYSVPGHGQPVAYSHATRGWLLLREEFEDAGIVGMRLELLPPSSIPQMRRAASYVPDPFFMLPVLPPMPGVTLILGGGSGGSNRQSSEAILKGPVEMLNIQSFYCDRLSEAGWTLTDDAVESRTAWSTWTATDEENAGWNGFLLIFQPNPERSAWSLRLEATLDSDSFNGQGGFGSMTLGPH